MQCWLAFIGNIVYSAQDIQALEHRMAEQVRSLLKHDFLASLFITDVEFYFIIQAQHCDKLTELLAVAQKEAVICQVIFKVSTWICMLQAAAARVELSNARADRHDPNLQVTAFCAPISLSLSQIRSGGLYGVTAPPGQLYIISYIL
jgi:hypothetical protein